MITPTPKQERGHEWIVSPIGTRRCKYCGRSAVMVENEDEECSDSPLRSSKQPREEAWEVPPYIDLPYPPRDEKELQNIQAAIATHEEKVKKDLVDTIKKWAVEMADSKLNDTEEVNYAYHVFAYQFIEFIDSLLTPKNKGV